MNAGAQAMYNAVLVDGVGNTREMPITQILERISIPLQHDPVKHVAAFDIAPMRSEWRQAEFYRLGALPDSREVYGFRFPEGTSQFSLWRIETSWVERLPPDGLREIERDIDRQIVTLSPSEPVKRLYDATTFDESCRVFDRCLMGVARKS